MDDEEAHYHNPNHMAARDELTEAVKKYISVVHDEAALFLGGTVVYETTAFDDSGHQVYNTQHVILDPSSLTHAVGLLEIAKTRLTDYVNR